MIDPPAATEVSEGIWLIQLPLPFPIATINVYLIRQDGGFLLLDCGLKTNACRQALAAGIAAAGAAWAGIRQIVITHLHPDHFGLAAEIQRLSGAEVLMHAAEAALLDARYMDHEFFAKRSPWLTENGVPAAEEEEISRASAGVAEFVEMVRPARTVAGGHLLPALAGDLQVIAAPGHSVGLITLYLPQRRLYFSTDHIVEKITPNVGLHSTSSENPLGDYLASLDRIRELDIDLILPAHGRPFSGHRTWIDATRQHHRDRGGKMVAAVRGRPLTAYEIAGVIWGNHLSPLNERFAVAETLAHLEFARRQGAVSKMMQHGVVRWSAS